MKKVITSLIVSSLYVSSSDIFAESALKSVNNCHSIARAQVKKICKKESTFQKNSVDQKLRSKVTAALKNSKVQLALGASAAIAGGMLAYRYFGAKKSPLVEIPTKNFLTKGAAKIGISVIGGVLGSIFLMNHLHFESSDDTPIDVLIPSTETNLYLPKSFEVIVNKPKTSTSIVDETQKQSTPDYFGVNFAPSYLFNKNINSAGNPEYFLSPNKLGNGASPFIDVEEGKELIQEQTNLNYLRPYSAPTHLTNENTYNLVAPNSTGK